MTIIVDIRPEVQAVLARRAAAQGRALEAYAASLLEKRGPYFPRTLHTPGFDKERARAAGERIRELRKRVTLGGLTTRGLIDEGRP
jgi:hypothetical protein